MISDCTDFSDCKKENGYLRLESIIQYENSEMYEKYNFNVSTRYGEIAQLTVRGIMNKMILYGCGASRLEHISRILTLAVFLE